MIFNGAVLNQSSLNEECRAHKAGYISSQTLGSWGYAFVDFGKEHIVTDHDGEATKSFIVTLIEKGPKTKVTLHEDKRHIYQEGDYVVLREVEGMTQINETQPIKIIDATTYTLTLDIDSSTFGDYLRQGIVENIKVPKKIDFHSWA